ncbi:putative pumilio/PUF RNA binding protein 1 [Trypanosoma grayi]|uniref:putative pumilio/PUF RNA binding protein 1 n=1 Tax=Trypanosoma grayi TaxID=71804 RepID=UPI0004F455B2|nr:putative pumilio/PUF RNA binding protein 1 [Trypanosoma grayi]KEG13453.1 putative pumilio/PUF RNA binding protein 1 [Trypanosoma grayi]
MSSDEEAVAALYAKRQELLKQLSEINSVIRTLEQQMNEKANPNGSIKQVDSGTVGGTDAERVSHLLDCCVRDSNGLRDAMKVVDACKALREGAVEGEASKQKLLFCNTFLHGMIAKAHDLALDPNGSELVQHALGLLKNGGSVSPSLHMTDYLVDSTSDLSEILLLLSELKDHIPQICCDTNGTRVMQKLFDCVKSLEEVEFSADCFSRSIITLCKDINGSHAVARLLAAARQANFCGENELDEPTKDRLSKIHKLLYDNFSESCVDVCRNRQGCCIIQKCLQWAPEPYFSTIIDTVLQNTLKLVHDPFGNYVIQFILDHEHDLAQRSSQGSETTNYTNRTIRQMLHNVASLSCNKFSSNVIEKCLKTASPEVRQLLVDELTDPQVLPKLLTDGFANYVIQTAIVTSTEESQFTQLHDSIMPLQNLLKNSPYGVKVEAKLARRRRECARKQNHHKQQNRRNTALSQAADHVAPDGLLGSQLLPGMHRIPTLVGTDALNQHAVAFSNVSKDMTQMVAQPQYMPFMFQGQQALIGLHQNHSHQPFPVNMMKEGTIWGPQQGFSVFHHPNQRSEDGQL